MPRSTPTLCLPQSLLDLSNLLMVAKALLALLASSIVGYAAALDFVQSSWIWTNEVKTPGGDAPIGARAFRKSFTPPLGKNPVMANIILTVDNGFTLYVNGGQVGTGADFRFAERFCVALRPCLNVISVTGTNAGGPAALLAAIEVVYDDGTTTPLVSDATWRYSLTVPNGYPSLSFDDNAWPLAIPQGKMPMGPWGAISVPSDPASLILTKSSWIWTNEVAGPGGNAPVGQRAFRRVYVPPTGTTPTKAKIIIACDNEYVLWVNGIRVGAGSSFTKADTYSIDINRGIIPSKNSKDVVFAVAATNTAGPAACIAAVEITSAECNCTSGAFLATDGSWKFYPVPAGGLPVPIGFQSQDYDDSAWKGVTVQGPYGMPPWGNTAFTA
ncbi:hypothetical protein MKEN_01231100 [Mycena kentingensis (nom. inval.)]|nr:hypothetical protein MKEN_01231100 [Mycena kentingensis (nom. inval.)]